MSLGKIGEAKNLFDLHTEIIVKEAVNKGCGGRVFMPVSKEQKGTIFCFLKFFLGTRQMGC